MSFRRRLALSCGAAVAITVVLGSALAYWVVRDTLRDRLDDSLRSQATMAQLPPSMTVRGDPGEAARWRRPGGHAAAQRRVARARARLALRRRHVGHAAEKGPPQLGDEREMQEVAQGKRAPFIADRDIQGERMRVLVSRGPDELAIFVARPLAEVDSALGTLRWALGLLALGGDRARGRPLARWPRAPRSGPWSR